MKCTCGKIELASAGEERLVAKCVHFAPPRKCVRLIRILDIKPKNGGYAP